MTRFVTMAVLTVAIGLGTAATADAQYAYRRYNLTPNGGVVVTDNYSNYGAYQTNRTYVSPYGTYNQRSYYNDVFGNVAGQSYGYNAYRGYGYNRGFYQPSPIVNPYYGGYNYYRRW
jgi:hypothetical protein